MAVSWIVQPSHATVALPLGGFGMKPEAQGLKPQRTTSSTVPARWWYSACVAHAVRLHGACTAPRHTQPLQVSYTHVL